jgi:putative endopeptidase
MSEASMQVWRRPWRARGAAVAGAAAATIAVLTAGDTTRVSASTSTRGIDVAGMDLSIAPGDDFFRYANGVWLARTEIPPDRSSWGVFNELAEETARRTRELLEAAARSSAPAGSAERQVGDYYAAYLDERAIEAGGTRPLRPMLARIDAIHDKTALARALGEDLRADVDPLNNTDFHTDRLFGLWVSPDLQEPASNAPYLLQGGLDLPDREYYLSESPPMNDIRAKYAGHVAAILRLAGRPDPDAAGRGIVDLETRMARVHATRLESLEVRSADNPWKRTEFATRAPGLDWNVFFTAAGLGEAPVIVAWHARAIAGLSALVASEPLETWKNWLAFHAIDRRAGVLPPSFMSEWFAFHSRTLSGTPQLAERWKRAVGATNAALGEAVGRLYVEHHFSPDTKAQVQALVANVVAAFEKRIERLDWMSPATKARAKEKLSTLYVGVGYPERWTDYSGLEVVRGDALGNAERAELFEYRRRLAQLRAPADKTEWWMTPQTVNAVNLPLQNALNFPAAILQPPSFVPARPQP